MKKIYLILFASLLISKLNATLYLIVPNPGNVWSATLTTVSIGDVIQFGVSATYPVSEVSQATWLANGSTTLSSGFGTKTTSYTFTITALTTNTIFFVCPNQVATGMKGMIVKAGTTGISSISQQLNQVSLFPNPANSELNITIPSSLTDVTLKLIAANGQEIEIPNFNVQINQSPVLTAVLPSSLGNGLYFVEISTANERIYKKIIITK